MSGFGSDPPTPTSRPPSCCLKPIAVKAREKVINDGIRFYSREPTTQKYVIDVEKSHADWALVKFLMNQIATDITFQNLQKLGFSESVCRDVLGSQSPKQTLLIAVYSNIQQQNNELDDALHKFERVFFKQQPVKPVAVKPVSRKDAELIVRNNLDRFAQKQKTEHVFAMPAVPPPKRRISVRTDGESSEDKQKKRRISVISPTPSSSSDRSDDLPVFGKLYHRSAPVSPVCKRFNPSPTWSTRSFGRYFEYTDWDRPGGSEKWNDANRSWKIAARLAKLLKMGFKEYEHISVKTGKRYKGVECAYCFKRNWLSEQDILEKHFKCFELAKKMAKQRKVAIKMKQKGRLAKTK